MRQKLVVAGIAFLFSTTMAETVWSQGRGGGRQQSSTETFWQWTGTQARQIQNAFARWQGQADRYWSESKSSGMETPLPNDKGDVERSTVGSSTGYDRSGFYRQSNTRGTSRGGGSTTMPYGGTGILGGRGSGSGPSTGINQGRGTGRGRSGQTQGNLLDPRPGLGAPGIGESGFGQGRGPCGQGRPKSASGRGRGPRRN
jgi:hypothetical protein